MKTNKILSCLAAGLLFAAGACTDEVKYDPADLYQGNEVYFDLNEIGQLDIETDATSVSFHLYRNDSSKDIVVGLESTVVNNEGEDASAIFGVPSEITFPAGETSVEVPVSVVFADVESEKPYTMFVKIAGESPTPYGATEGEFTLLYGIKYVPWREYMAGQPGWFQMAGLWTYYYDESVYVRESINRPELTQYRISGPFSDLVYDYLFTVHSDVEVAVEGAQGPCYLVTMETLLMEAEGFDPFGDGSILAYLDGYTFIAGQVNPEYTPQQIIYLCGRNDIGVPYFDTTTGMFHVLLVCQKAQNIGQFGYYPSAGGWNTLQLPGFKKYNLAIYETGFNVDAAGDQQKKFTFYKNDDVEAMKYGMYAGTLTEEEVTAKAEELLADGDVEEITDNEYSAVFELASGDYTVVLAGIDGGELVATKAYSFSYVASSNFVTVGTCEYSDAFMSSLDTELPNVTVTCEVQEDPANPKVYRIKNPYRAWAVETENEHMLMDGNYYLTVNCQDPKLVYIEESNLGLRNDIFEGPIYGYSVAAQSLANGVRPATIKLRKQNGTLTNNVISFPVNTLLVASQSELPDYQPANIKANFKIVLNLDAAQSKGRIAGTPARTDRVSLRTPAVISETPVEASIR